MASVGEGFVGRNPCASTLMNCQTSFLDFCGWQCLTSVEAGGAEGEGEGRVREAERKKE